MITPDAPPAPLGERLAAQLLSGPPAEGTSDVAGHLLAIQAQDQRGARLAVRARSRARSAADVDDALTRDRSVVVTWLNRGTLHLVRTEDYWWLHPLTTPPLRRGNERRLAQEGVPPADAERGVAVIERSLAAEGPLTRAQLRDRIAAAGVRTEGQAIVHVLMLASLRGLIVRGPMAGREHAYALVRDWLGAPPAEHARFDRDRAAPELDARIDRESALAETLGARGTPAFLVNGALAVGWGSWSGFRGAVERELIEARKLIETGVPRDAVAARRAEAAIKDPGSWSLYRSLVVDAPQPPAAPPAGKKDPKKSKHSR